MKKRIISIIIFLPIILLLVSGRDFEEKTPRGYVYVSDTIPPEDYVYIPNDLLPIEIQGHLALGKPWREVDEEIRGLFERCNPDSVLLDLGYQYAGRYTSEEMTFDMKEMSEWFRVFVLTSEDKEKFIVSVSTELYLDDDITKTEQDQRRQVWMKRMATAMAGGFDASLEKYNVVSYEDREDIFAEYYYEYEQARQRGTSIQYLERKHAVDFLPVLNTYPPTMMYEGYYSLRYNNHNILQYGYYLRSGL